jgi:hypothetical protein
LGISRINKKIMVILEAFPGYIIEQIESDCKVFLESKAANTISSPSFSLIAIEIIYAYARNFRFSTDKNFKETIAAFIAEKFSISFRDICELNDNIALSFATIGLEPEVDTSDFHFIDHLVLNALRSNEQAEQSYAHEMEQFIYPKIYNQLAGPKSDVQFLSPLEQEIQNSIAKITSITGDNLVDIDCFFLEKSAPNLFSLECPYTKYGNYWAIQLATYFGQQKTFKESEVREFFGLKFKLHEELTIQELIQSLVLEKLIIRISERRGEISYALTDFAYNISANTYALGLSNQNHITISNALAIHPTWSKSAIDTIKNIIDEEFLISEKEIHPDSLHFAAQNITANQPDLTPILSRYLENTFKKSSNPFVRKNCIDAIGALETVENKREYISSILKDETSELVVNSSLKFLLETSTR